MTRDEILSQEYSERFDKIRRDAIVMSFHKYGPCAENIGTGRVDAIASLKKKLLAYERTHNTEYLADVANYAMLEFMHSPHPDAHYKPMDGDRATLPVGTPINMER